MECKEFKNIVAGLFDREADPQLKAECERHMAECAECKRYYDEMSQVADMLRPRHSPVREEHHGPVPVILRWAAMFIGVLMLSGIAYAAIRIWTSPAPSEVQTEDPVWSSSTLGKGETKDSTLLKPVVFEDAELETILREMTTYYNYQVIYQDEAVRHTRLYYTWDRQMPIEEIIETFNQFKRIHVTAKDRQLFVR